MGHPSATVGPAAVAASQRRRPLAHIAPHSALLRKAPSLPPSIEFIGSIAAVITTLAWLPQIFKILRERRAGDISLVTNAALASGVFLWIVYGLAIGSLPVILANSVTLLFILGIVALKLRFG
jgi:MtN3 and saliva related transmembrane protein